MCAQFLTQKRFSNILPSIACGGITGLSNEGCSLVTKRFKTCGKAFKPNTTAPPVPHELRRVTDMLQSFYRLVTDYDMLIKSIPRRAIMSSLFFVSNHFERSDIRGKSLLPMPWRFGGDDSPPLVCQANQAAVGQGYQQPALDRDHAVEDRRGVQVVAGELLAVAG